MINNAQQKSGANMSAFAFYVQSGSPPESNWELIEKSEPIEPWLRSPQSRSLRFALSFCSALINWALKFWIDYLHIIHKKLQTIRIYFLILKNNCILQYFILTLIYKTEKRKYIQIFLPQFLLDFNSKLLSKWLVGWCSVISKIRECDTQSFDWE